MFFESFYVRIYQPSHTGSKWKKLKRSLAVLNLEVSFF